MARLIAWRVVQGLSPCSADTGAYCTARSDLPEEALHELVRDTGKQVEDESPQTWLWHGRKVRVVDGSTITMPDTPENQAAYPQQKTQKPGCGFPIARILVIFSLSAGTVLEAAIGKYKASRPAKTVCFAGFTSIGRRRRGPGGPLFQRLERHCLAAAARHRRGDPQASTSPHGLSHGQASGQRRPLGSSGPDRNDRRWMSAEQYATLPDELTLREVRIRVAQKGFRTRSLVVVTTLAGRRAISARRNRLVVPAAMAGGACICGV